MSNQNVTQISLDFQLISIGINLVSNIQHLLDVKPELVHLGCGKNLDNLTREWNEVFFKKFCTKNRK